MTQLAQPASPIRFDIRDGIAFITLDRPQAGNAIDMELAQQLLSVAIRCETDASIRCAVLSGAGRLFCAGGDIASFAQAGDGSGALLSELAGVLHMAVSRFARMACPLITVVHGPAAGAGMSLAMLGDVVLASPEAHFTPAYSAIGLTPDGGMSWLLPRLVGMRRAQEILLTNRRISAEDAADLGIVTRVVAADTLAEDAAALAQKMAQAATGALGGAKALLLQSWDNGLTGQLEAEAQSIAKAGMTGEFREGLAAFLEKRPPNFRSAP